MKDKSARLLVRTRACTHLSITVVEITFTYYVKVLSNPISANFSF